MLPVAALAPIVADQLVRLVPAVVKVWRDMNPQVTLEQWLEVLNREDVPYKIARAQHFAKAGIDPYSVTGVVDLTPGPRKVTADEVMIAITTGVIPNWFPPEVVAVVSKHALQPIIDNTPTPISQ